MRNDVDILIVPDVHGRSFWREPVKEVLEKLDTNTKIVFLGDYVDPYIDEFIPQMEDDVTFDYQKNAIVVLNDIIDLKYKFPNNIILLLGNHDCGYCIGEDICTCRRDRMNANVITEIFKENRNIFQLAYQEIIDGKNFIFSHAGISTNFINWSYGEMDKDKIVDFLNEMWYVNDERKLNYLGVYDSYRGYSFTEWASPIWADIRQMYKLTKENTIGDFQVVGHTQLPTDGNPYISDYIGDFDCRECFYIDTKGNIRNYKDFSKIIVPKSFKYSSTFIKK